MTKIKGAARAKSGCYTCRIRRKKCDEQKSDHGSCKTCDRLHLECLGYGVKRPEWLRESQTVVGMRNKIKKFLASQGMIKGHSGPSSRDVEQEPNFLTLRPCSSPESETSTTLSVYQRSGSPEFYCESPPQTDWSSTFNSSRSGYPLSSSQCPDNSFLTVSRMSMDYHDLYPLDSELQEQTQYAPRNYQPSSLYPIYEWDPATDYYIEYVFESQYLLANRPHIKQIIRDSLQIHPASKKIVQILSELHYGRRRLPQRTDNIPPILHYLKRTGTGTLDDAMAVLHSVSVYLFNGGDGAWDECIDFAASHVQLLLGTTYYNFSNPLQQCDAKTAFVVKTAIWFDVLASITTGQSPRLHSDIGRLFDPRRTHLHELGDPLSDQHSMLSPMGSENDVVWAISEISALAEWKQEQQGFLSIPELVNRAAPIQQCLDNPACNQPCRVDLDMTSQHSASSIFRAAAQLYLATVVSGDYPLVPEVSSRAQRTYDAIFSIPQQELPPVVRSTVFAFFLCGCFLIDPARRTYIKDMLLYQEHSAEIGNLNSIINLLDSIWATSDHEHKRAIPWRSLLRERHILLV
ncbi:hypothetical protein M378DRAFT_9324 [Amanita muscaria Koide BX008]|uniref:Zn(2)-C6 fungal-type domain-containing protein n=1 Tax=Amanita muscaria (strain Koide BX008) TaxID=946122 RepID=A0A0C2XDL8_AMAMK|nr:hypothetical protein M378DRAFT_9324 [Amanita muscaria Koide BX008]